MIKVTERAKQELQRLLAQKVDWPGARLRIIDRGNGDIGLGIDLEAPGDEKIEVEGQTVLVCEPGLAERIKNITIDVDETPAGVELVISGDK